MPSRPAAQSTLRLISARGVRWVRSGKAMLFATVRCG